MNDRHSLFGTDGVRGLANAEPMSTETVLRLGRGIAVIAARSRQGRPSVVIGRDTRRSGAMLEAALAAGIASAGADVVLVGEIPTPAVAFLTAHAEAAAGAVISASHNPFEDNGVKVFGPDGFKLADAEERQLEDLMRAEAADPLPTGADVGTVRRLGAAQHRYQRFLRRQLPKGFRLDGMRVAIDGANGAAYRVGPKVLEDLGAQVTTIGASPDGLNINRACGALHPLELTKVVRAHGADIGVALDGDADRLLLVDGHGDVVDGDQVLSMLAFDLLARDRLRGNVVVGTVMTNMGLEVALREREVRLVRAAVGDRYVVDEMRKNDANLGGEPSGHIVLLDHHTTGDGMLAALMVMRIMQDTGKPLAALKAGIRKMPQVLKSVRVSRRRPLEDLPELQVTLRRIAAELAERGRVLVRFSGTEPVVRVMVEGEDRDRVEAFAQEVAGVVEKQLSAAPR